MLVETATGTLWIPAAPDVATQDIEDAPHLEGYTGLPSSDDVANRLESRRYNKILRKNLTRRRRLGCAWSVENRGPIRALSHNVPLHSKPNSLFSFTAYENAAGPRAS
jgi:hypothetical protein